MGFISGYPKDTNISLSDKLLGTDAESSLATKNFEIADFISFLRTQDIGSQGPIGPQGVQGVAGAAGPIGPAGLNWQGQWGDIDDYVEDDAVGYNGASYFCILATSGATPPPLDTTHWALLASQGAQGVQGTQGPIGPQGPQGPSSPSNGTNGGVEAGPAPYPVLTFDINTVYQDNGIYRLPQLSSVDIGKQIVVQVQGFISSSVSVKSYDQGPTISTNQTNGSVSSVVLAPNDRCRFTYLGSEYWFAEYLWASKLKINNQNLRYDNNLTLIEVNTTTTPLSLSFLNSNYPSNSQFDINYHNGFQLVCPSISTGALVYTKTSASSWISNSVDVVV